MKRDVEGSDVETRRRSACDLVKVLASQFDEKVTGIFSQFVQVNLKESHVKTILTNIFICLCTFKIVKNIRINCFMD